MGSSQFSFLNLRLMLNGVQMVYSITIPVSILRSGPGSDFHAGGGSDGSNDFIRRNDGTGVVWEIDFESGVHVLVGVARGRVFYHRALIAEFGGIANGGLHTGVRDQSHDDDFVNAALLELHIQIRVGKAAGTPMLRGDDIARLRFEPGPDFAAPRTVFERLPQPPCFLNGRDVLPGLVVAIAISSMHRVEHPDTSFSRCFKKPLHMRNTLIPLGDALYAIPDLAALGNEVVIRIDQDNSGDLFLISQLCHVPSGQSRPRCRA